MSAINSSSVLAGGTTVTSSAISSISSGGYYSGAFGIGSGIVNNATTDSSSDSPHHTNNSSVAMLFPTDDSLPQQQQQLLFLDTSMARPAGQQRQQQPIGSSRFLSLGLRLHDNQAVAGSANNAEPAASDLSAWSESAPGPTRLANGGPASSSTSSLIGLLNASVGGGVAGLRSPGSAAAAAGTLACRNCSISQSFCQACRDRVCPDCVSSGRHALICSLSNRLAPLVSPSGCGPVSPSADAAALLTPGGSNKRPLLPPWSRQIGSSLSSTSAGQPAISGALERLEQKENSVAAQYEEVAQRVRGHFRLLRDLVAERESQLMTALLQVKALKLSALQEQRTALLDIGTGADLTYLLQPWEDERLFSVQPPLDLARLIRTSCAIYSSACAQFCRLALANGDKAFVGKPFAFRLLVFDHLRQPCTVSANEIDLHLRLDCPDTAAALNPYGQVQPLSFPGQYQVTLVPERPGRLTVNLRLRGRHVPGSPFVLPAMEARDYSMLGLDVRVIGRQGDGDLEFNRPWGICADESDNLLIADRSNNQIKIIHCSGRFLRKFGQRGEGPGEFNRPAGVCLGSDKRIYVADKDNHRIQMFTWHGQFMRMFGKQGKGPAEFNYPWDLAVSKEGRLAVADSRNHRIQLFTEDGDYLTEFSIARSPGFAGIKSFDCPRGIVFTASGQLLCTDFNLHRFLVIEADFSQVRFLGVEGQGPGQFCRPQGVAVDLEGNIIICEARNHRLQILNSRGAFVRAFGSNGSKIGQLNRPACVCVLSTGQLALVDSENHRVLLL